MRLHNPKIATRLLCHTTWYHCISPVSRYGALMQPQPGDQRIHQIVEEFPRQRFLVTKVEPGQTLDDQSFMEQ